MNVPGLDIREPGGIIKITVTTGGSGYTSAPAVAVNGISQIAYAVMAGTVVDSVIVQAHSPDETSFPVVSFSGGGGTGAAAVAVAHSGALVPMRFFKGRNGDLYGVDGMGRGVRYNNSTGYFLGLNKPCVGPTVTASTTGTSSVIAVQMVNGGAGYNNVPAVSFSGGSPTRTAKAKATIADGRVFSVIVTDPGKGYQSTPAVAFSDGVGTGASFTVGAIGGVARVRVLDPGSGYKTTSASTTFVPPTVTFGSSNGLSQASAAVVVNSRGGIESITLLSQGTGCTALGVTASISNGSGSGAQLAVDQFFSVSSVTVATSGSGYATAPFISFQAASNDTNGGGAAATCTVNATGNVSSVTVYRGGTYARPPTALILNTEARAMATVAKPLVGTYKCCFRYIDGTPESEGGPIASSISELKTLDAANGVGSITWSLDTTGLDSRVAAAELWRTTSDQSVILFRVATVQRANFGSTYADSLSDSELTDPDREGYGLMPVTLPSGQPNARRFGVPPGEFREACMFQDRAWYAVDTTGARPNTLMYSEVDEPESVHEDSELVVQENTGESDTLVALAPLGSMLLLLQTSHLYRLTYVAQPVIDASIVLGAYRGILNSRCWDILGGVAFIVDSHGMYAYDGQSEDPVSVPVDNFWRDNIIDFSQSDKFHVSADSATRTVWFYYCQAGDSNPVRALCYCLSTKAWWQETYPTAITATCRTTLSGKVSRVLGRANGTFVKEAGSSDSGAAIAYAYRSGALPLGSTDPSKSVTLVYNPTTGDSTLNLRMAYNNAASPRANAISTDRGAGFVATQGATGAALNLKKSRSALGDATGVARAGYQASGDLASAGADRHVAVIVDGSATERVTLHGIAVEGAG